MAGGRLPERGGDRKGVKIEGQQLSQDILTDLWRRRLDTLASGIANDDLYYLQIANAAEHIGAEHQGRFLIELIQNANDQAVRQGLTNSFFQIQRFLQRIPAGVDVDLHDRDMTSVGDPVFKSDKTA